MDEMNDDQIEKIKYILDRQDEAFKGGPDGTWAQRWIPGVCKHVRTRCVHGDEILGRKFRRQVCLVCGRALQRPLPYLCFFTGEPHEGAKYPYSGMS